MYDWELTDDALKTWVRLRQASEAVEKVAQKELDKQNSTTTQVGFLSILDASKTPLTPGQLAKYTFREQHSVSAQLSRMWRAGLVKKTRQTQDQRVVKISMTAKGKEHLGETRQAGIGQARNLLASALSDDEGQQLDKLLKKVRDRALQQLGMEAEPLPNTFDATKFLADLT